MFKEKDLFLCGVVLFFCFTPFLSKPVYSAQRDLAKEFISSDADIVVSMRMDAGNKGLNYISGLVKERQTRKQNKKKNEAVQALFEEMKSQDVAGEIFISQTKQHVDYFFAVSFVKDADKKKIPVIVSSISSLLKEEGSLETELYSGQEITYSLDRSPRDISAYALVDDAILLSNTHKLIKKAIDVYAKKSSAITSNKYFNDLRIHGGKDYTAFLFVNSLNNNFTRKLRKWEADYYMTVLLSAESLNALGVFIDFINEDSIRGKMTFMTRDDKAFFDVVQDDAWFFSELLKRKALYEDTDYKSNVIVEDTYVDLDFDVKKLKPVWGRIINREFKAQKGLEYKAAAQPIVEPQEVKAPGKVIHIEKVGKR